MCLDIGSTFTNKQTEKLSSHLWFVISYPFNSPEQIVIVNLTSWRLKAVGLNDSGCILEVGDHEFVRHKSYINYSQTKPPYVKDLHTAIDNGLLILNEPCKDELFIKILDGASNSKFTPLWVISILTHQKLLF